MVRRQVNYSKKHRKSYRRKHRHMLRRIVLSAVGLIIIFYGIILFINGHAFYHNSYSKGGQTSLATQQLHAHQPINVLIMGTDTGALHRTERYGRTDELMMNTLNPQEKKMRVVSIPRDSLTRFNGHDAKVNSVYETCGAPDTQQYVGHWLHVPINYYMLINLGGLERLTSKVGGVTVDPPLSFKNGNLKVQKGHPVHISGRKVLDYCQMRYQDPRGDYGRQLRQRQVLFQLIHQVTDVHNLTLHPTFAKSLCKYIRTNLSLRDLADLALYYRGTKEHETSTYYQGYSKQIDGQDYQILPHSEIVKESEVIKKLLI